MENTIYSSELKKEIRTLLSSYASVIQMIDEQPNNKVLIDILNHYMCNLKEKTSQFIHVKQVNSKIGM